MGELRWMVAEAAREAFDELRSAHADASFYAFALEVSEGSVAAHANTEQGLLRTAERFAAAGYGTADALASNAPGSLRWRTADWEHTGVLPERFAEVARAVEREGTDGLVDACVGAFRDLNREDFFGWGPDRDAVVLLVLTGDPADTLDLARDVNPAVPFARLQAALS